MPASFENSPRAIPYLIAVAIVAPVAPPQAADGLNAASNISAMTPGILSRLKQMITSPTAT